MANYDENSDGRTAEEQKQQVLAIAPILPGTGADSGGREGGQAVSTTAATAQPSQQQQQQQQPQQQQQQQQQQRITPVKRVDSAAGDGMMDEFVDAQQ